MPAAAHHEILIIGAGTAGITTAARLRRKGKGDVAIVEPADTHYYQPLWTLVGAGIEPAEKTARPMAKVMPKGVAWIKEAVADIDPEEQRVTLEITVADRTGDVETTRQMPFDFLHAVPPQSAPDWLKATDLSEDTAVGYVDVDPGTLRHTTYPNVYCLGDASNAPTAKTGAAIRKQAPVVVDHLLASIEGRQGEKRYNGYSSCPITTARGKLLLAEFDYNSEPAPSIPLNTAKERTDMWYLKRYGLPALYWNLMLKGLA